MDCTLKNPLHRPPKALNLADVPFARRPVQCVSDEGITFTRWFTYGMPQLGRYKWIKDIVVFLYENKDDAKASQNSGGTGFFVSIPTKRWPKQLAHWHCVTNYHVAVSSKEGASCPVIAVNTRSGEPHVIDLDPSQWIFVPGGPDIAVSPPQVFDRSKHLIGAIDISSLTTTKDEMESGHDINVADDVFMVGRFIDYTGVELTPPAFRFGHISIMDAQLEQDETGYLGRSIVCDMHSRSGFSGSPVFVYRTLGAHFLDAGMVESKGHFLKVLGIHWGQFPEDWEIDEKSGKLKAKTQKKLERTGPYIRGLSGMTCVIPAQEILNILNLPELEGMREAEEERMMKILGNRPLGPIAESSVASREATTDANDENPKHREDFTSLVGAAARKQKQGD